MKNTVTLLSFLAGLIILGVLLASSANASPAPVPHAAPVPRASEVSDPTPFLFDDETIVTFAPKKAEKIKTQAKLASKKELTWTCGGWEDSAVGGGFKRCEWK